MKKTTFLKSILFVFIFLQSLHSVAQKQVDFTPRYDKDINGDIILIGNNILNRQSISVPADKPNVANDDIFKLNSDKDYLMNYVNTSPAAGVYNSSSANLVLPDASCSRIVYAGLYWSAVTRGTESITDVKFKMPTGGYNDIKGTVIHDTGSGLIGTSKPYTSYADVTNLIKSLGTNPASGEYTVANVSTAQGTNGGTGLSAGWSLFIVYENVYYPRKSITSFDGFWVINKDNNVTIPVSGFRTIPNGRVKAKFAFSAIEGDRGINGDFLQINNVTMTPPERPLEKVGKNYENNFFNSTVTSMGSVILSRNPASKNTLGFDAGVFEIDNPVNDPVNAPGGSVLGNNKTKADIFLGSDQDLYYFYFTAFAVEVIAPDIVLTKAVLDKDDNPAGGKDVRPEDDLRYTISFQNKGNDDATNFTITDQLPVNVKFDETKDILLLPTGVTVQSYNAATRTIVFKISDNLVKANGGLYTIKFRVKVANCDELTEPCSNIIKNIAYSKYNGVINTDSFGDGSFDSTTGCDRSPSSTNFLVGLDKCVLKETVSLCGTSVDIKGPNGFPVYTWKDPTGAIVGGNNQTITATKLGNYVLVSSGANPCVDITKTFQVIDPAGSAESNPINKYADNIDSATGLPYICTNNGKPLPKIFLCGANESRDLTINLTSVKSIVWQETTQVSTTLPDSCPNESPSATWNTVATGQTFVAERPGFFKVIINYTDVCLSTYYFNVYQNPLDPKATTRNITCDTKGRITVTNPPAASGYKYSLDGVNYVDDNVFNNVAAGTYTVYIKQTIPTTNANSKLCDFKVQATVIDQIFTTTILTTDPYCAGDTGTIKVTANNVNKQYKFVVYKEGTTTEVGNTGLIDDNYKLFTGITPGRYDVITTTSDGCYKKDVVEIFSKILKATASLTKNLTCANGEITIVASGGTPVAGTPPYYYYFINGSTTAVTDPKIVVSSPLPAGGNYSIVVVDALGCRVTLPTIKVTEIAKPTYTLEKTDVACYGVNNGQIKFNVTNTNGYTLRYSINNGTSFVTNGTFSNLAPGTYTPVLEYSLSGQVCTEVGTAITISGPATALTASGGVAELAGCGTGGTGKLRFTNAQGGTAPYEYSFDGGSTFQSSTEKYVVPGTYTLVIRDSKKCTFTITSIILDPKPADPVINEDIKTTYNCDGSATATIEVATPTTTSGTTYTYEYYLKTGSGAAVANTPITSNIFTNVPSGSHTVIVKYNVQTVSSYSNLLQEDFGKGGFTTTPGINPAYCFEDETTPHPVGYSCGKFTDYQINDGKYAVASAIKTTFGGSWLVAKDHTTPTDPLGRFLCVNVGGSAGIGGILYSKPITDVLPNQPVIISLWAENLIKKTKPTLHDPKLTIQLVNNLNGVGGSETIVATTDTTNPWVVPKSEKWEYKQLELNPGAYTNLSFVIRSYSNEFNGNDVLIDDIWVRQVPESCGNERSVPVIIDSSKAFNATQPTVQAALCSGTDGSIKINAQNFDAVNGYYYSTDNGVTFIKATSSPVTVALLAGDYKVIVKNDVAGTCKFTFDAKVTAPSTPTVTATVTTQATCTTGATITAIASNGTPGYFYQLSNPDGTIVVPFRNNGVFTNVASGNYVVVARDTNKCTSSASATVLVNAPTAPTATIVANTARCFDPTTGANITVNVSGGLAPYSYQTSTNGGTSYGGSSASFTTTSFTYNASKTGTYTFKVTDANGCIVTTANQIINDKLTVNAAVTTGLDCEVAPDNQAVITGTISGGTAPFTVTQTAGATTGTLVQPTASGTSFTYSIATAGTYTFQITDAIGCVTTASATINALVPVTGTATVTDVTCFNAANGSVTLAATAGVAPFTYSFNNSAFTATTTYPNFAGSVAGTSYDYVIKDNKGCTYPGTVSIKQPEAIAISASITTTYNCDHAATITALATKGNGSSYTYTLFRGATTVASNGSGIFSGITTAGSYTVQATDSKSCSITSSPAMVIVALNPPTAMTITNTALKCTTNKVDVTIETPITGGTGTLTYSITAPATATTNVSGATTGIFTNLDPGTYTFQVKDANNCTFSKTHTITALPAIAATAVVVNNVKCYGTPTGSIKYTISGFATGTAYSYTIDGGTAVTGTATGNPFDITISALSAGAHPIVITNTATACTATATATVAPPTAALAITAPTITAITCTANATAVINTTGGWGSNSYTVTGTTPVVAAVTQSNNTFTNLTAGTYTAAVTDANGCSVSTTFTIAPKVDVDASIDTANSTYCYVAGTGATIKAIPGATANATNYMYSINGGTAQASGTFTGLVPGTYTITVSDTGTKCSQVLPAVTIASPISASTAITKDLDCTTTTATSANATIQVSIANGYAPYEYQVRYNSGSYSTYTSTTTPFTYSAASAGVYDFQIKDSKGCTTVVSRTINAIALPTFTYSQVNVKCKGDNTGSITVSGIPASGTYQYSKDNGLTFQSTNTFTGLIAGTYPIVIKDSKSCISLKTDVVITEPTIGLTATASASPLTCSATNTQQAATITVTASNGTPFTTGSAYLYSFNGGGYGSSNTYTVNTAGNVTISVKDVNGCTYTVPSGVTIAPLNPPTALSFTAGPAITCTTTTTSVTAAATGGSGTLTYTITAPASATTNISGASTGIFTGLAPNTYTFKVTDANGCSFTNIYRVDAVTPITVTGSLVNNVSCNGANDGSIKFTVAGNSTGFTYVLKNTANATITGGVQSGNVVTYTNLLGGTSYTLTVTNPSTGCTAPATVAVSQPTAITTLAASGTKVYCTQAVTTITVSASGGTTPLYYAVVPATAVAPTFPTDYNTSGIFTRNTATLGLSYTAYVVDKNGNCEQTIAVSITQDATPTVTASAVNQCLGTGSYTITATTPLGAIAPVTYSLNGGGFVTSNTFTVTAAGDYSVTIKDGNGCTATSNTVTVYPKVTISAILNKDVTCAYVSPFTSNDAQITVTAAGGNGPYTYTSSPTSGTFTGNVFRTSTAGSYTFTVTDASGNSCSATTTTAIAVTTPVNPDITGFTQTQFIKCSGDTNGAFSVAIDPTLGQAPFKYSVNGGAYQTSNTFTGLAAGVYNVTVQDAKGCTNTDSFTIAGKSPMVIDRTVIPIQCNSGTGVSKGSIIINKITDGISTVGGTGGTAPYTYYVTGINGYNQSEVNPTGNVSTTFNVVDFGLYQIRVVDANGCSVYENDVLVASPVNSLGITIAPAANCTTGGTADVTITSTFAGIGPFHFNIYSGPGQVWTADGVNGWQGESTSGSKTTTFTGLLPGVTYTFIVYDFATKCYYYETAATPIPTNSTLALTNVVGNNVKCFTDTYGSVNFDITNNYATAVDVTYQVYESFTNNLIAGAGITVPVSIAAGSTLSLTEYAAGILPVGTYYVLVKEASGANAGCSVVSSDFNIKKSTSQLEIAATAVKKSNCNELGSISAEATKGTGPYRYQVVATGDPVVPANWTTTAVFDRAGSIAGIIYDVYALDSYGCIVNTPVTVYADENPTITAPASICYDGNAFTIAITGTVDSGIVGAESYSVNGSAYQSSPNFTFNAAGTYNLMIKDGNGCTADVDYVVYPQLDLKAAINKGLDCTGSPDATITLTTTGGNVLPTPNYTYTVSYNSGVAVAATSPYAATAAGDYVFTVTDANNGTTCTTSATVTIDAIPTPTITPSVTDVSCFSGTDGAISVAVSGGVGPFTYALTSTPAITNTTGDATGVYTGLAAGTNYVVTVTDAKSCTYPTTITVGQPTAALAGSATVTTPLSCGAGNVAQAATVTLSGTGGTGTYEYSFDNSAYGSDTVYTVNDTGINQSIPYGVKDANGCEVTGSVTIDALDPPTNFDLTQGAVITCATNTTSVTISNVINGVVPFTYQIVSPIALIIDNGTTATFNNLAAGDYVFQVTDANGCVKQLPYTITDVTNIDLQVTAQSDVICDATATGTAIFAVTGFAGTYSVTVNTVAFPLVAPNSNTSASISLTGLAANTYIVRVTDDTTGCFDEQSVTIANPTAALTSTNVVTPLGCTTTASVAINAAGGWGSYEYTLTPPSGAAITQNTNVFNNLSDISAPYTTSVKDANGCTITDSFILLAPVNPTASIDVASVYCYDGSAATTLVVTAASASTFTVTPYEYSIDNGATWQTTDTFTGLTPGTYAVMVKDAFGCTSTAFNATIEAQLFATAVKTKELDCTATPDGTIRITPTDGYSPYAYRVSSDAGITFTTITATDPAYTDYTVPAAGSYVFEVTDSKGCQYVTTPAVVMTAPTAIDLIASDITTTPVDCNAPQGTNNNGTITVTLRAVNDNPDYTYTLNQLTPVINTTTQSTNLFTGLTAGTYEVVVTSARGCVNTPVPVTIAAATPVEATATAAAFSCSPTNTVNTTTVTVTGTGGKGANAVTDYTYSADSTNWFTTNTFEIADTGATQNLNFYVKDANGCVDMTDTQVIIAAFPKLVSAVATQVTKIDCVNLGEEILVTITGGSNSPNPFSYEVYQDGVLMTATPISVTGSAFNYTATTAGSYYEFKIFDNNTNCTITSDGYEVPLYNTMVVNATAAANVDCTTNATGKIELNITGYSGAYTYEIFNGATSVFTGTGNTSTNPFVLTDGLVAGTTYTVQVTQTAYPQCVVVSNVVEITEPALLVLSPAITVVNKNCFNEATATVPATAVTGGTGQYLYAFVASGTAPTATDYTTSNTATLATTTISPATTPYDVWVKDANGCTSSQTIQVTTDPLPAVTAAVDSQCASATGYTITATGSLGKGALAYSLDGISFQTANTFNVTAPGTYTVTVRDANQCTATATAVTILEPLQLDATITTTPTCTTADGVVTLTAQGGTVPANYEYSKDGTTYVSGNVFSGLAPNNYTFYVRDNTTSCFKTVAVVIDAPNTTIDFSVTQTAVTCNGGNDGTILVTLATPNTTVNTNPIYTYSIDGTNYQDSNLFEGLTAGTYTVHVLSGKGCPSVKSIDVDEPQAILVPTPVVTKFSCTAGTNGANFATITVNNVTGGSGTYTVYEFIKLGTVATVVQTGPGNVYTEADYVGGSYIVNVYDDKSCTGSTLAAIDIDAYNSLDKINVNVDTAITCKDPETITAQAIDVAGNPITGIEYTLADDAGVPLQPSNTSGVFNNLNVGNYIITAFNSLTGCSIQKVHYVNEPNTFELQAVKTSDVVCFGSNEGAVTITLIDTQILPTNDAGEFTYTVTGPTASTGISDTAGQLNLTGLTAGLYTVSARLTNIPFSFCTIETTFTIDQPVAALTLVKTHTDITCITGNNDGSISVSASGGWPGGYEYQLLFNGTEQVAYSAQYDFTDLVAGNYTVNVRDSKICVASTSVTLVIPTAITATVSLNTNVLTCYDDANGILTVDTVTGGSGNYLFSLTGTLVDGTVLTTAPQTATTFTDLKAGSYQVVVTDDWTCTNTSNTVVLREPNQVVAGIATVRTETCAITPQVELTATGGTGPYFYSTDGINFSPSFASSVVIDLPATTTATEYKYYVKDTNGCNSFITNVIEFLPVPTLNFDSLVKFDVKCTGSGTGAIYVTAQGGLGNYVYSLVDQLGNVITPTPTQTSPGTFTGLSAGNYLVKVESLDCSYFEPIEITEPALPLISTGTKTDITCNGLTNGSFEAIASGGTGQIKYAISPALDQFFDSGLFKDLEVGIYQVLVQDENGCYIVHDFEIKQPTILYATYDPLLIIPEVCFGDRDGAFMIEVFGGSPDYKVSLDDINGTYTQGTVGQTRFDFINLIGGTHTVYIEDASGCTSELEVIMPDAVVLNPIATVTYDCVNNTQANRVVVTYDASNDPADLDFDLDGLGNWQVSNIFENLAPGTHSISVRHANGCIQQASSFDIIQVDPLGLAIDDGDLNQIKATATGGAGDYEYSFNGEAFTKESTYAFYKTGIYPVTVRDKNGCTVTVSREFTFIDVCISNYFTPNGDGTLDTWGPGCSNNYPDLTFDIFDRYGRAIAKYRIGDKWDGKYKGEELPSGDYWYVIKLNNNKDNREFVGHFTLYR